MSHTAAEGREEIKAAIQFYEARGWDWLDLIGFLSLKHTGRLQAYLNPYSKDKYFLMRKREQYGKSSELD